MNLGDMRQAVRDLIREQTSIQNVTGENFQDTSINRYLAMAQLAGYYTEIEIDPSKFLKEHTFTGDGSTEKHDLPDDYMKVYQIKPSMTSTLSYTEFNYRYRSMWQNYVHDQLGFYYYGKQVGLVNVLGSTSTALMDYYSKYTVAKDNVESDLHDLTQYYVILYAAELALKERADANITMIRETRKDWLTDEMPNIRGEDNLPRPLRIGEESNPTYGRGYRVLPT